MADASAGGGVFILPRREGGAGGRDGVVEVNDVSLAVEVSAMDVSLAIVFILMASTCRERSKRRTMAYDANRQTAACGR